jgi:GT2 family glycosyltransferase
LNLRAFVVEKSFESHKCALALSVSKNGNKYFYNKRRQRQEAFTYNHNMVLYDVSYNLSGCWKRSLKLGKAPTVHIGIVTYNSIDDLARCFDGISRQNYPQITVTVLDNASIDESVNWIRQNAPDATLIVNEDNVGFARAHNQILRKCDLNNGDLYMPLNPDVLLQPEYIEHMVTTLHETNCGWATGKLLQMDEQAQPTDIIYSVGHALCRDGYAFNIGHGLPDGEQFSISREVFGAPGAAAIISKALIDSIAHQGDLYDPDMFLYNEDVDLDWRARRQGWRCYYVADAVAYHRGSQPDDDRRARALGNRYLSVIKNAYYFDFLCYNLPVIIFHCCLRLLFTPRRGIQIIWQLLLLAPAMLHKRQQPKISRQEMHRWFQWSAEQPTGQPVSWLDRLSSWYYRTLNTRSSNKS